MNFYKNGNYVVMIMNDGTKIRKTNDDEFIPSFAENCDVKVTDKCSIGCPFCYEGCTPSGKHADFFNDKFKNMLDSLHPYTEMALNGNDLDHPDFEKFLMLLKEKKVFANITVQQTQFINNYETIKKWSDTKLVYGIGVSLSTVTEELLSYLSEFPNAVVHTINGILKPEDVIALKSHNIKMLILGYKDLQRGVSYKVSHDESISANQKWLYEHLDEMIKDGWMKVISFDNLAIEQLEVKRLLEPEKWEEFYMGDDGHYTFYIDMVKGEFAKNSLSQVRYPINGQTIDEMFNIILKNN